MKNLTFLTFTAIAALCLLLAGCATSLNTYSDKRVATNKAVVLIVLDSEIPLVEGRNCNFVCTSWYQFNGKRDVMAFPTSVGSNFKINTLLTADGRAATFNGDKLKIEKPGIYYYASIVGDSSGVRVGPAPTPEALQRARLKYFDMLQGLPPVNFTWPENVEPSAPSYKVSANIQRELEKHKGRKAWVDNIAPPSSFRGGCRMGKIGLPDYLPYEIFFRLALKKELETAGLWNESTDARRLSGRIVELQGASTPGSWRIVAELGNGQTTASVDIKHPFRAGWMASDACDNMEDEFANAAQAAILKLVESPNFGAML